MTAAEIETALTQRDCSIVEGGGKFALVYPHGYELRKRSRDLMASNRSAAAVEAWLWLHPESAAADAIAAVQRIVAVDFGVQPADFIARDRSEPLATARRVAMALAREVTGASLGHLGAIFERDHGAVLHAQQSVRDQCETDDLFAARVGTLRAKCLAEALRV